MPIDPLDYSPFLWFDASQIAGLSNNDPVSTWNDLSGNGRHLTGSGSARPTYVTGERSGLPVVRFDGSDDIMATAAFSLSTAMTLFIVCRFRSATNGQVLIDGIASTNRRVFGASAAGTRDVALWAGGVGPWAGTMPQSWFTYTGVYNGASSLIRKAGVTMGTGNPGSNNWGGMTLGARFNAERWCQADVAEILVVPSALSSSDIEDIEAYLEEKWHRLAEPNGKTVALVSDDLWSLAATRQAIIEGGYATEIVPSADLGTHDFSGYDALAIGALERGDRVTRGPQVRALIDGGLPTLFGFFDNGVGTENSLNVTATQAGLFPNAASYSPGQAGNNADPNITIVDEDHPIATGLTAGDVLIWDGQGGQAAQTSGASVIGTAVADAKGAGGTGSPDFNNPGRRTLIAVEAGTTDHPGTGTVGARVVLAGILRPFDASHNDTGRLLIRQSVDWLVEAGANQRPTPPTFSHTDVTHNSATITRTPGVDPEGDTIVAVRLQVATTSDFSGGIVYDSGSEGEEPDTEYPITGLDPETQYWYRGADADAGGFGEWSEVGTFTTAAAPSAPTADVISAALDGDILARITVETPGTGGTSRVLQASATADFTSFVTIPQEGGVDPDPLPLVLWDGGGVPGTRVYYRTALVNSEGTTYSNVVFVDFPVVDGPAKPTLTIEDVGVDFVLVSLSAPVLPSGHQVAALELVVYKSGVQVANETFPVPDPDDPDQPWREQVVGGLSDPGDDLTIKGRWISDSTPDAEPTYVAGPYSDLVAFTLLAEPEEDEPGPEPDEVLAVTSLTLSDEWPIPQYRVGASVFLPNVEWSTLAHIGVSVERDGQKVAGQTVVAKYRDSTSFAAMVPGKTYRFYGRWIYWPPNQSPRSAPLQETFFSVPLANAAPYFRLAPGQNISAPVTLEFDQHQHPEFEGHDVIADGAWPVEITRDGSTWTALAEDARETPYEFDPSGYAAGFAQFRVRNEPEYEEPSEWRLSAPVYLNAPTDRFWRLAGDDLTLAKFTTAGTGAWSEVGEGEGRRLRYTGGDGTGGFAALVEAGEPRSFEIVAEGQWATGWAGHWISGFFSEMAAHWGVGAYLRETPYTALTARLRTGFGAWGRWIASYVGEGGSDWWQKGMRYGRGTMRGKIGRYGPGEGANPAADAQSAITGHLTQWLGGAASVVGVALSPWYTVRARYELLGVQLDGSHRIRVQEQIWGPDNDRSAGFALTYEFTSLTWPCGPPGLIAVSGSDNIIDFRSVTIVVDDYGDCAIEPVPFPCEPRELTLEATPQEEAARPDPILYPISPNWADGLRETRAWLTDVITGSTGIEQRVQLRATPRRRVEYSPLSTRARNASIGDGILWRRQSERLYIPLWQHASLVREDVAAAGQTVSCLTADRGFVAGGKALLWVSPAQWEIVDVDAVGTDQLELDPGTVDAWAAWHTQVIPLAVGVVPRELRISRPAAFASEPAAAFELETVGGTFASTATWLPTLYRGLPLLEISPDRKNPTEETLTRPADLLDTRTGAVLSHARSTYTTVRRRMDMVLFGRAEINAWWSFLHACAGRLNPVWIPTFMADLQLFAPVAAGSADVRIRATGYATRLFPRLERRDLAFIAPGGVITPRRVTDAEDMEDGTELLTLEAPLSDDDAWVGMISFLPLCRLASDEQTVEWQTQEVATAVLETDEIPFEVPEE